jgi:hypothetical protein
VTVHSLNAAMANAVVSLDEYHRRLLCWAISQLSDWCRAFQANGHQSTLRGRRLRFVVKVPRRLGLAKRQRTDAGETLAGCFSGTDPSGPTEAPALAPQGNQSIKRF